MNVSVLKSRLFLVPAVAGLFLVGSYFHGFQTPEHKAYALASNALPSANLSSSVAVIAIDNAAIKGIGSWPWPRERFTGIIDQLRDKFKVRAIGIALPLTGHQTPAALAGLIEDVKDATNSKKLKGKLETLGKRLDSDGELARAIKAHGNVVLAAEYTELGPSSFEAANAMNPGFSALKPLATKKRSLLMLPLAPPAAPRLSLNAPLMTFIDVAAGVGAYPDPTNNQSMTAVPLAVREEEKTYPSFISLLLALTQRIPIESIQVIQDNGVQFGRKTTIVTPDLNIRPLPPNNAKEGENVPVISVTKLWESGFSGNTLKNKTVLIGLTENELTPLASGAGGVELPPVVWAAHSLASLLMGSQVHMPVGFYGLQRLAIVLLAVALLLMPQHWSIRTRLVVTGAVCIAMLNAELVVLITNKLWLPMVMPTLFLLTAQALLCAKQVAELGSGTHVRELAKLRRDYAGTLISQGRLDEAFSQYLKSPLNHSLLEPLYELGLAYEEDEQYDKAIDALDYAALIKPSFRDIRVRLKRLNELEAGIDVQAFDNGATANKTVVLSESCIDIPKLGHYRLEREIGRGAMAVVYLATDEKLGRNVAIKTLRLIDEFKGETLQEAQVRFRREAKAAARLSHPNNITIYETGSDNDLEYIVMDYAKGESLENYTDPEELLTVWEVLEVGVQVADALAYAHERQVVHRDVKPSNIIYDRETGIVKVTDFGIACLTDSSRTRTGTVLGTPSYMSPEQAAGKKLDGRSDLFSLGVTMYQLLTGRLPFVGDSLANLVYQITTQKHPTIRKIRPSLNASISRIINRTLQKDPDQRYCDGAELSEALLRCQQKMRCTRKAAS